MEKWQEEVDTVNPLAPEFHTKRLLISEIAHPVNRKIANKRIIDCELIGPANLMLLGVGMNGVSFVNCETVVLKKRAVVRNAVALEDVTMMGGTIWNCTFFVPPQEAKGCEIYHIDWITRDRQH